MDASLAAGRTAIGAARSAVDLLNRVDPSGRISTIARLHRLTGRDVSTICELRMANLFIDPRDVARAVRTYGVDGRELEGPMRWGAIAWPDPPGAGEQLAGLPFLSRGALDWYLERRALFASTAVWLFPDLNRPLWPVSPAAVEVMLRRARISRRR